VRLAVQAAIIVVALLAWSIVVRIVEEKGNPLPWLPIPVVYVFGSWGVNLFTLVTSVRVLGGFGV
jgi:hypothetical protein